MINLNPNKKRYLYFHFLGYTGEDSYFKLDMDKQKVTKICLKSAMAHSSTKNMVGIYYLKWQTFMGNYVFLLSPECRELHKKMKRPQSKELKYTTEQQFNIAFGIIIKELNGKFEYESK